MGTATTGSKHEILADLALGLVMPAYRIMGSKVPEDFNPQDVVTQSDLGKLTWLFARSVALISTEDRRDNDKRARLHQALQGFVDNRLHGIRTESRYITDMHAKAAPGILRIFPYLAKKYGVNWEWVNHAIGSAINFDDSGTNVLVQIVLDPSRDDAIYVFYTNEHERDKPHSAKLLKLFANLIQFDLLEVKKGDLDLLPVLLQDMQELVPIDELPPFDPTDHKVKHHVTQVMRFLDGKIAPFQTYLSLTGLDKVSLRMVESELTKDGIAFLPSHKRWEL